MMHTVCVVTKSKSRVIEEFESMNGAKNNRVIRREFELLIFLQRDCLALGEKTSADLRSLGIQHHTDLM